MKTETGFTSLSFASGKNDALELLRLNRKTGLSSADAPCAADCCF
jgi:hypothetical protein